MTTATETTVRPIVVGILADHEDWLYLLHPEMPVRPATPDEMARVEDHAYAEYAAAMASRAAVGSIPHGPWPHSKTAATAPAPAAEPEPDPQPEAADDPALVLDPIAELALQRFNEQQDAQDAREATADGFKFHALSECEDEAACPIHGRNDTAQIPAVDAITTATPAVTEEPS